MSEIIAALDEGGANNLLDAAIGMLPAQSANGSGNLGPFTATYAVSATLVNGDVDLVVPDIIRIEDLQLNWTLNLGFAIDLGAILPEFCLPRVCVKIPCVGRVCTPRICIDWPTIPVNVSFSDFLKVTGDFKLNVSLSSGVWKIEAQILGVPNLQFGATTAALLAAIAAAVTPILLTIPFIGPLLAIAVDTILLVIGIAGVTGLLGPILTPFVSGLKIPIYNQPQLFEVLPAESAIDPQVTITIDAIAAEVQSSDEDELVLLADISA
jgi:hypothetical protein